MLSILCWFGFLNFNIVYHGFLFYCTYSLCLLYFYFANKCFQSNMIAEETQPPRREACDDKTSRTGWVFLTIISSMTRTFRQQDEQDQLNDSWGIEITQTAWELRLFVCKNGLNRVSIHNDSHDKSAWGGTHHYSRLLTDELRMFRPPIQIRNPRLTRIRIPHVHHLLWELRWRQKTLCFYKFFW